MIPILQYPDKRLRRKGKKVSLFDADLKQLIDKMFHTLYHSDNCAALAATQLNLNDPPHVTVIDFSPEKNTPLCLINGEIVKKSGEQTEEEGCMSVGPGAGYFETVTRAAHISVRAQRPDGSPIEFEADGFMAKCIQHELDHLNGVVFLDHLSALKRQRLLSKLKKRK